MRRNQCDTDDALRKGGSSVVDLKMGFYAMPRKFLSASNSPQDYQRLRS